MPLTICMAVSIFSAVSIEEVGVQDFSLSIPLYVRRDLNQDGAGDQRSLKDVWKYWQEEGYHFWQEMDAFVEMLDGLT